MPKLDLYLQYELFLEAIAELLHKYSLGVLNELILKVCYPISEYPHALAGELTEPRKLLLNIGNIFGKVIAELVNK